VAEGLAGGLMCAFATLEAAAADACQVMRSCIVTCSSSHHLAVGAVLHLLLLLLRPSAAGLPAAWRGPED
jgi:hypothetical protein